MKNKQIAVRLTNGFGNNLFQYIHGRIMNGGRPIAVKPPSDDYYALKDLKKVGLEFDIIKDESKYKLFAGYYEDYKYYKPYLDEIKSWFVPVDKLPGNGLVLHMRLGDRLLYKNSYEDGMYVKPETYSRVIKSVGFDHLFIVTDMPVWKYITEDELNNMKFHVEIPNEKRVNTSKAVNYMNSIVEEMKSYKPCSVAVNIGDIACHFCIIRGFDKIVFQHSTMAWWAAAISNASTVGVYGPWRPVKGDNNKNLGNTDYPGWFSWK